MTSKVVRATLIGGAWVLTICGLIVSIWAMTRPIASLGPAVESYEAGRMIDADRQLRHYLRSYPEDGAARLILARTLMEREEPEPESALDELGRIDTTDPLLRAQVLLIQGRAWFERRQFDAAESAWLDALRLDPKIAEVGWHLLSIYYLQGRPDDARRLALQLHQVETDPEDRVRLLLELARWDVEPPAPSSLVSLFKEVVRESPTDPRSTTALGLALIAEGRLDEGLDHLRRISRTVPHDLNAQAAWLDGLLQAGRTDELAEALEQLPNTIRDAPRFARHRGRFLQDQGDWTSAAAAYRQAIDENPADSEVSYRLRQVLRLLGHDSEASTLAQRAESANTASDELQRLYPDIATSPNLGSRPDPALFRILADLRERMGHPVEALAWYRLALDADPDDPDTQAATERLASLPGTPPRPFDP